MAVSRWKVPALLASVLLAGCTDTVGPGRTHICWINFVQFDGTRYADFGHLGRVLEESDLGPQFATVKFRLEGNVQDPEYRTRDGDAAFLEPGTPIYTVKGYKSSFRLAARAKGRIFLFEADRNTKARRGTDLLDLFEKVDSIRIHGDEEGRPHRATITDPRRVALLVGMILSAPVDLQARPESDGKRFSLVLHLKDGTGIIRSYAPTSGFMHPGVLLPEEFGTVIGDAVRNGSSSGGTLEMLHGPSVCHLE